MKIFLTFLGASAVSIYLVFVVYQKAITPYLKTVSADIAPCSSNILNSHKNTDCYSLSFVANNRNINKKQIPQHLEQQALYLPFGPSQFSIYIDGDLIWQRQNHQPSFNNRLQPFLVPIAKINDARPHKIDIVSPVFQQKKWRELSIYFGPIEKLQPVYKRAYLLQYDVLLWALVCLGGLGVIVFAFSLSQKYDRAYRGFSICMIVSFCYCLYFFYTPSFLSPAIWDTLHLLFLVWPACASIFVNQYLLATPQTLGKKIILLYAASGLILLALPLQQPYSWVHRVWISGFGLLSLYGMYHLAYSYLKTKNNIVLVMLSCGVVLTTSWLHDALILIGKLPMNILYTLHQNIFWIGLLFAWILFRRFYNYQLTLEAINKGLEQEIQQKKQELELQYKLQATTEQEKIIVEERERIMRDMHDGMGSQLMSLSLLFEHRKDEPSQKAFDRCQDIIQDLRFVIDSLDPSCTDLTSTLANIRCRNVEDFNQRGITLHWDFPPLNEPYPLSPKQSLQLMRISQEICQNCLKYANAKHFHFNLIEHTQGVTLSFKDDGVGFDIKNVTLGRGLNNIQRRAKSCAWAVAIQSGEGGTLFELQLPKLTY